MTTRWLPTDFCPNNAQCSMQDALHPSNGAPIQTMEYPTANEPLPAEIRDLPNGPNSDPDISFYTWVKCEGQLIPIAQRTEMFSMMGTKYGGDGRTTFGIPDLRTAGQGTYYICLDGQIPGFTGP